MAQIRTILEAGTIVLLKPQGLQCLIVSAELRRIHDPVRYEIEWFVNGGRCTAQVDEFRITPASDIRPRRIGFQGSAS